MNKATADKIVASLPAGVIAEINYTSAGTTYRPAVPKTKSVTLESDGWRATYDDRTPGLFATDRLFFAAIPDEALWSQTTYHSDVWELKPEKGFWNVDKSNTDLRINGDFKEDGTAFFTLSAYFKDRDKESYHGTNWRKAWAQEFPTLAAAKRWVTEQRTLALPESKS